MAKIPLVFSPAGKGGSRRLLLIGGSAIAVVALVAVLGTSHQEVIPASGTPKMGAVDALPGGLHSTPQQNNLADQTDREGAQRAAETGSSYTPPLPPGVPVTPAQEAGVAPPALQPALDKRPAPSSGRQMPPFRAVSAPPVATVQTDAHFAADPPRPQPGFTRQVSANPQEAALYQKAIDRVMAGWGGRAPRTELDEATSDGDTSANQGTALRRPSSAQPELSQASSRVTAAKTTRVLVPAGRGIYAHTIVAVDSDTGGPIVLQADTGPLAGDRLIGMFSKAGGHENLLIVQITKVVHQGEELGVSGLVISPSTMQTAVASSVDQHYLSRFALPAAAAFVQGLGSALATTSNTIGTTNALGGTNYVTSLNLPQQLGVAAGAAAQQIGTTLAQQAPTGPTIHLDANASVGVIFLGDVKTTQE